MNRLWKVQLTIRREYRMEVKAPTPAAAQAEAMKEAQASRPHNEDYEFLMTDVGSAGEASL